MASVAKLPIAGSVHWLEDHIVRGASDPHAEVTMLTPGLASVLLARNPDNRNITAAKLRHFVSSIRRGRWELNGETIILSKEGLLNDGQTRCTAVVEANTPIMVTIFFGADRDTRKTVDTGSARTAAHMLGMDGLSYSNQRGAIARWLLAYEASDGKGVSTINSFSSIENYDRAKNDPEIEVVSAYIAANGSKLKFLGAPAMFGAIYYILRAVDEDDAKKFMDQIVLGENLKRRDPAYTLRDKLMGKCDRFDAFEAVLRAWNAFRQKRSLATIPVSGSLPGLV